MSENRKNPLVDGQYYHIISRSIAKYKVFNTNEDYLRFSQIMSLYQYFDFCYKYSNFLRLSTSNQSQIINNLKKSNSLLISIVAYCIMPTHIHLLLRQNTDLGISTYLGKILNSYTRYFNIKHNRKGPLWEGRFKNILVDDDEQLLHLTRYIHLNPVSAGLVDKPEEWVFSSYNEYIDGNNGNMGLKSNQLCDFKKIIDMSSSQYQKFVDDRIGYQKELSKIKHLLIDNYNS